MARPRPDDWLSGEIAGLKSVDVDRLISLLEDGESRELGLIGEATHCRAHGIDFVSFPIPDRGIPRSVPGITALVADSAKALQCGTSIVIHCRAGIGRSSIVAGAILVYIGISAKNAMEMLSRARRVPVPDTAEQEVWLHEFAAKLKGGVEPLL